MGNRLIIGLSDENMKRLSQNQPIKFDGADVGFPGIEVFIFNGKDEQTMRTMMKDAIHPTETIIIDSNADKN